MTAAAAPPRPLGWLGIIRLGLVQTALGAIVILTTSTMNRVMVVELLLPAALPGALVALHYAVQLLRPWLGYGSDKGGRRTPWIIGGMAALAVGATTAALATAWMATNPAAGIALAVFAFLLVGIGVGAAGTSLLVLLAKRVDERRRAPAATIVWVMMIAGFVVTATGAGHVLDPFTTERLVAVTAGVSGAAFLLTLIAVQGVEGRRGSAVARAAAEAEAPKPPFLQALAEVWAEPQARRFTIFVFVSMLAYSTQDLILEPFAGLVFNMTPGESTKLAGIQHGGVLLGMIAVGIAGAVFRGRALGSLRAWTIGGCLASAVALGLIAFGGLAGPGWPLRPTVMFLGFANGAFAVAAIASMMALVGKGRQAREGVRMGVWGAAQAIAFGLGGFAGTVAIDVTRLFLENPAYAYGLVFTVEAAIFVLAAWLAVRVGRTAARPTDTDATTSFAGPSSQATLSPGLAGR